MNPSQIDASLDRWGRILFSVQFLVYPYFHFVYGPDVANIVPPWIPGRLFWTYFCGASMVCAAVGILFFKKLGALAALLLGLELFLFLFLIHASLIFRPSDPWVVSLISPDEGFSGELTNFLKDVGACGGAFIIAASLSERWEKWRRRILGFGRTLLAISIIALGAFHFFYPAYAPGVPPHRVSDKFPFPGQAFLGYLIAVALLAAGISILVNWRTRLAASLIGAVVLAFALLTWIPHFFAHPAALTGNWLRAINLAGGLWVLASLAP